MVLIMTNSSFAQETEKAIFAGGCFWCMEPAFEGLDGILEVVAGYSGGKEKSPGYAEVSSGRTGHLEAIEITYDPSKIKYEDLLDIFWKNIDPTDKDGQFADKGSQYTSAIFYTTENQLKLAEASKENLENLKVFDRPIITAIRKAQTFYPAENYHQDYYKKNPIHYNAYKEGSGRKTFLQYQWGGRENMRICPLRLKTKNENKDLKNILTPTQYQVTQENKTEPAFKNEYWDNKEEGIYVDIVSGKPLFASTDKFDSGTGWPSFTKPIDQDCLVEKQDDTLGVSRIEIRSQKSDSHLGHVFSDGPGPDGQRFCINSSALRFISKEDLEKEGYEQYKNLFY